MQSTPQSEAARTLYQTIRDFDFDGGPAEFPFHRKLAKENAWSESYAKKAIQEYLRFVALSMTSGHRVSPSHDVDQVWHLHLTYTRSYWERLMPMLPRQLHHEPSRGGSDQSRQFAELYQITKDSYRRAFGEPPFDLWPDSALVSSYQSGTATRSTLVPNRRSWWLATAALLGASTGALAFAQGPPPPGSGAGTMVMILVGIGVVAIGGMVVWNWVQSRASGKDRGPGRTGIHDGGGYSNYGYHGAGMGMHGGHTDGADHGHSGDHGDASGFADAAIAGADAGGDMGGDMGGSDSGGGGDSSGGDSGGGCGGGGCGGGGD